MAWHHDVFILLLFTFAIQCQFHIYPWLWQLHIQPRTHSLEFTPDFHRRLFCRASRQQSSFPYLKHLLCLVLMTTALWLTSPSWWSVLRNRFSSTSNTTSLPAWTLTGMLTDPQRMPHLLLFVDLSSAFNTISPMRLITTLNNLGFSTTLCNWILDFLTEVRKRISDHTLHNVQHSEAGTGAFNPSWESSGCLYAPKDQHQILASAAKGTDCRINLWYLFWWSGNPEYQRRKQHRESGQTLHRRRKIHTPLSTLVGESLSTYECTVERKIVMSYNEASYAQWEDCRHCSCFLTLFGQYTR